jgi:hypothetical protein
MSKSNYNDKVKEKILKYNKELSVIINEYPKYTIEINEDNNTLEAHHNKKRILSAKYQILGLYDEQCHIFRWSNKIQLADKKLTRVSKKIKAMCPIIKDIIVNNEYSDIDYLEKIMYYLSNNIFIIYPESIINLINFCIFVTKHKGVIKGNSMSTDNKNIYVYYLITDIIGT